MRYSNYDIVIIGSGLAGLYLANKLGDENCFKNGILVVTKSELYSGSTSLAQGGIVSVIPELNKEDTFESHIKDTLNAGCGLNNISVVEYVSKNSYKAIQELMKFGVEFDKSENKLLNFTLEGAHSHARIAHAGGDSTGSVIEKTLVERTKNLKNVDIYENTMALEILKSNNEALGVILLNEEKAEYEVVFSKNIVIATGGLGQIYSKTTNPSTSTGDGIAMAYRAGCEVENMEFVQFHPTGLYCKNSKSTPLISESVRGEGARLVNPLGNYFAKNYHHMADLAPRDVVARAIHNQITSHDFDYVNLDISSIGLEQFKKRFPTISKLCKENNIDLSLLLIPVTPCQHYLMGGIKVDINSKTTLENVYAIGECSSTGLHGANRLASNSLLECAVFAHSLFDYLIKNYKKPPKNYDENIQNQIAKFDDLYSNDVNISQILDTLKTTMSNYAGILRDEKGLNMALNVINNLSSTLYNPATIKEYELYNALCCAKLVVTSALERKQSIGAHYRSDDVKYKYTTKTNKGNINNDKLLA
ncbi:L-aspartate oxidase [bacterium]|nr:L-aspartate oxidase [bacterium]